VVRAEIRRDTHLPNPNPGPHPDPDPNPNPNPSPDPNPNSSPNPSRDPDPNPNPNPNPHQVGAEIRTFLLERSRVVSASNAGERAYHIMYQVRHSKSRS
jgi:outer membrane biosynthesis protein TonB